MTQSPAIPYEGFESPMLGVSRSGLTKAPGTMGERAKSVP